jgi:uncharacterized membrane protein
MRSVPVDMVVVLVVTALLIVAVWSSFERENSAMRYRLTDQGRTARDIKRPAMIEEGINLCGLTVSLL